MARTIWWRSSVMAPRIRWRLAGAFVTLLSTALPISSLAESPTAGPELRSAADVRVDPVDSDIEQFYALRNGRPAWQDARRLSALVHELLRLDGDGLNPDDYAESTLQDALAGVSRGVRVDAHVEVIATRACLRALSDLHGGKVDPRALDPRWPVPPEITDRDHHLRDVSEAIDAGELPSLFDHARPASPFYARLRASLSEYRGIAARGGWPTIPAGPELLPGHMDPRVPALTRRLLGDAARRPYSMTYTALLARQVAIFQAAQYLHATGVVDEPTREALNVSVNARIDQLRVNLERARWLLNQLHGDLVLVDLAGYKITYFRDGQPIWRSRVQVGETSRPTPLLIGVINEIEFNPRWRVPQSILLKDLRPQIEADPRFLQRHQFTVLGPDGMALDPAAVDWRQPTNVWLQQAAGPNDALGRVELRFQNPDEVFLHDTPHKLLFRQPRRNFSSGCIRVEQVFQLVRMILDMQNGNGDALIRSSLATNETRHIPLSNPVRLILQYWTVDLPPGGGVGFKPDTYGRDAPLLAALNATVPLSEGAAGYREGLVVMAERDLPDVGGESRAPLNLRMSLSIGAIERSPEAGSPQGDLTDPSNRSMPIH